MKRRAVSAEDLLRTTDENNNTFQEASGNGATAADDHPESIVCIAESEYGSYGDVCNNIEPHPDNISGIAPLRGLKHG